MLYFRHRKEIPVKINIKNIFLLIYYYVHFDALCSKFKYTSLFLSHYFAHYEIIFFTKL